MVNQSFGERRQAVRAKRVLSTQYRRILNNGKKADSKWYLSTTNDMSILGMSFLSEISFQVNDKVEIHVVMSGILEIYKGFAEVVRVDKKSTGVYYLVAVRFVPNNLRNKDTKLAADKKV